MKGVPALGGGPDPAALIAYPFPLSRGVMGRLNLPSDGLSPAEAERLAEFVRSLTVRRDEREAS